MNVLFLMIGAADVAAEVVVGGHRLGGLEGLARIEVLVVVELVRSAVDVVGAGLQDDVCDGAAGAAELGLIVAGADVDVLQRLDGRDQDGEQAGAVVVVHALELHVVSQAADAVHLGGQRALRVEELGVRGERAGGAGHEVEQRLEAAVVARWADSPVARFRSCGRYRRGRSAGREPRR